MCVEQGAHALFGVVLRLPRFLHRLFSEKDWPEGSYAQQLDAFRKVPLPDRGSLSTFQPKLGHLKDETRLERFVRRMGRA